MKQYRKKIIHRTTPVERPKPTRHPKAMKEKNAPSNPYSKAKNRKIMGLSIFFFWFGGCHPILLVEAWSIVSMPYPSTGFFLMVFHPTSQEIILSASEVFTCPLCLMYSSHQCVVNSFWTEGMVWYIIKGVAMRARVLNSKISVVLAWQMPEQC